MKTIFIPAKVKSEINAKKISELKLSKKIAIAYSIQFYETASEIKKILSKNHVITQFIQVLGCSRPKFSKETQAVLLISSGKFHAVSLAFESNLPVYILEAGKLMKISDDEIDSIRKRKKASYARFLNSNKIGILVSTKPGQENLKKSLSLSDSLKNKDIYLFISNEINVKEFENFSEIQSWINTSCPRLDFDSSVINISDLNLGQSKNTL